MYVTKAGNDSNDGRTWATAKASLQAGVDTAAANGNCDVWAGQGTYVPTWQSDSRDGVRTKTLNLPPNVALYGGFAGNERSPTERLITGHPTVISGEIGDPSTTSDNLTWVVTTADGSVLDGVTVTAAGGGGGVFCQSGALTVKNTTFGSNAGSGLVMLAACKTVVYESHFVNNLYDLGSGGYLWGGGGVADLGGDLTITNSDFTNNQAKGGGVGGAIYAKVGSTLTVSNVVFTGNSSQASSNTSGGAIYLDNATLTLEGSIFQRNTALLGSAIGGDGTNTLAVRNSRFDKNGGSDCDYGAIYMEGSIDINGSAFTSNVGTYSGALYVAGNVRITNAVFDGNSGGGAIYNGGTSLELANCLFTNNVRSTYLDGGAIYHAAGTLTISQSTFYGNTAAVLGHVEWSSAGAIWNASAMTVTNSIFWADKSGGAEIATATGAVSTLRNCDVQGAGYSGANGNISSDPLFTSSQDLHLQAGSPCVNAGSNASIPPDWLDLNGNNNTTELLPVDRDGKARVVNTTVDMGCYESAY